MVYHPVSWQERWLDSFEGRVEARHISWPRHGQSCAADYYGCAEHGSATNDGNGILVATHDDATTNDDANVVAHDDADAAAHDANAATSDDDGHAAGYGHGPTYAHAATAAATAAIGSQTQTRTQAPDPVLSNPAITG